MVVVQPLWHTWLGGCLGAVIVSGVFVYLALAPGVTVEMLLADPWFLGMLATALVAGAILSWAGASIARAFGHLRRWILAASMAAIGAGAGWLLVWLFAPPVR